MRKIQASFLLATFMVAGVPVATSSVAQAQAQITGQQTAAIGQGNRIRVNGRLHVGDWSQNDAGLALSDSAWMQVMGGDLADAVNPGQQPVEWYSAAPVMVGAWLSPDGTRRYLNIAGVAQQLGWQLQPAGAVLNITTSPATLQDVRLGQQPWGRRLVLNLSQPAPWQLDSLTNSRTGKTDRQFTLTVDADFKAAALQNWAVKSGNGLKALSVAPIQGKTQIKGTLDGAFAPYIWTLNNPPRLIVDIRATPRRSRRIAWAPGVEWREQTVNLGSQQFPLTWLAVNPQQPGVSLQPVWSSSAALVGKGTVAALAQSNRAAAVINAGFFNRDRETPLGVIRRDGNWISSPILNRGVVAWNSQGQMKVGRLRLQETLQTSQGQQLTIVSSNSGYPQKGMARYTRIWGPSYTPLTSSEQVLTVINDQISGVQTVSSGQSVPIPSNGSLLVKRSMPPIPGFGPGVQVQHRAQILPAAFEAFPNMMGAGPLLVEDGRVVVNAIAEQFSPAFAAQAADRSAIAQTAAGQILLVVVHNRVGGAGPTLPEWAQLMQKLGAVNALNLDGGSSTALYLGGQILDRHPVTSTRVQNGIGLFFNP